MNEKIGAIILAAGGSTRLGKPKQLVRYAGKTLVRRIIEAAEGIPCSPVVLVLGSQAAEISKEAEDTSCLMASNPNWRAGMGTSIRVGVRAALAARPALNALLLVVCDQYFVTTEILQTLVKVRMKNDHAVVASEYSGTIGVPAIFGSACFDELLTLPDDSGAKSIILKNRARTASVPFPEGALDVDSLEDVEKLST